MLSAVFLSVSRPKVAISGPKVSVSVTRHAGRIVNTFPSQKSFSRQKFCHNALLVTKKPVTKLSHSIQTNGRSVSRVALLETWGASRLIFPTRILALLIFIKVSHTIQFSTFINITTISSISVLVIPIASIDCNIQLRGIYYAWCA